MSFLLDYTTGIGLPRPVMRHQEVLSFWLTNMNYELRPRGFFAIAENAVIRGKGERVPDIVIYDRNRTPLSFFEIARTCQIEKDIEKCEELMDRFPDVEFFVYDYEEEVLYFFDDEAGGWVNSEDGDICSKYLQKPVIEYID